MVVGYSPSKFHIACYRSMHDIDRTELYTDRHTVVLYVDRCVDGKNSILTLIYSNKKMTHKIKSHGGKLHFDLKFCGVLAFGEGLI